MKKDSFDIPAYKFCVLRDFNLNDWENLDEKIKTFNKTQMVPFENVDGLTIGEVQSLLHVGTIVCLCYLDGGIEQLCNAHVITIIANIFLNSDIVSANQDMQIDEAIGNLLEENYYKKDFQEKIQKVARCFFERYQDQTHSDTKERVKRLEKKI